MNDLLIVAAVEKELEILAGRLEHPRVLGSGKQHLTAGRLYETPVRLLITGPGQVNTARAMTAAVEMMRPRAMVQIGAAGAFAAAGLQVGDISLATDQWYNIGIAIHDDYSSSRFHHVSLGFKLGFDDEDAEINAIGQ